jgi:ribosomal protein L11
MKKADLNPDDPERAVKMIAGTARNMGIEVVE